MYIAYINYSSTATFTPIHVHISAAGGCPVEAGFNPKTTVTQ
jgi:hypothetical protein